MGRFQQLACVNAAPARWPQTASDALIVYLIHGASAEKASYGIGDSTPFIKFLEINLH